MDNDGAFDTDKVEVRVEKAWNLYPYADAGGPYSGVVTEGINTTISFDGSKSRDPDGYIVGYKWSFDNNQPGGYYETEWLTTPKTTYQFSKPGIYSVTLRVKDNEGKTMIDSTFLYLTRNQKPVAVAKEPYSGRDVYAGLVNEPIKFDGSASFDPDGRIVSYRWDWTNDGSWDTAWSYNPIASHSYSFKGNYTVKLEVKDNHGATDTDTAEVHVSTNIYPVADAGGPYTAQVNELIRFNGSKSYDPDGQIKWYRWDFNNDGYWDTVWDRYYIGWHRYSNSGQKTIRLEVKDNLGYTDIDSGSVNILHNDNPIADAGGPYVGFIRDEITFDGSNSTDSDGGIVGYRWDLDNDGVYDTQWLSTPTIKHSYTFAGEYTIKLQVKDDLNAKAADITTVKIIDSFLMGIWHMDEGSGIIAYDSSVLTILLELIIQFC
jgi:hypothetical protein